MINGDCLLIERHDGHFDLFKVAMNGAPQPILRDISDGHTAWQIANAKLQSQGREIYFKHEDEPDTAIRPCRRT